MVTSAGISWARPTLFGGEERLVLDALRSTWISGGPYVERLEKEMAHRLNVRHAIAVSNGTTAIELALRGLGLKAGDEVIVPAFTFVAAPNMVLALGLTPLYADIDPETYLLDASEIRRLATPRTKAVIPVHLYGNVANMNAISSEAASAGLFVVEDAAEATFSRYEGRYAGTMGQIGTFSFHATKTITTGEGGMVVTGDSNIAERCRILRDHGMLPGKRYWHDVVGHNFRLSNMQAALGCGQLEAIDHVISERAKIHSGYMSRLGDTPGISLQRIGKDVDPVVWVTVVRLNDERGLDAVRERRDKIMDLMACDGIETRPGFYDLSMLAPYGCPALPVAQRISASTIALPTYIGLGDNELDQICNSFRQHFNASK